MNYTNDLFCGRMNNKRDPEQEMKTADYWIKKLGLDPHPEGGYFREIYRAAESVDQDALPERFSGSRSFSTSIYYLLGIGTYSAFHKINQDEIWHFYDGGCLNIHIIEKNQQNRIPAQRYTRPDRSLFPLQVRQRTNCLRL